MTEPTTERTQYFYPNGKRTEYRDLQLGDVIRLDGIDPFNDAIVVQRLPGVVTLFRVYATSADFSYTGGVIPYIGVEQFTVDTGSGRTCLLLQRKTLS